MTKFVMMSKDKYRVLFISSWYPNKEEPTNGNFVQRHAESVSHLHNVEVLHCIGTFNQEEEYRIEDRIINNIRTLVVYYKNSENPFRNFVRRMLGYKKGFSRLNRPNIVHANVMHNNLLFAVYLKKRYKIPFVISEHWTAFQKANHSTTSTKALFTAKFISSHASYVLPVSEDLKKSLIELGVTTQMKVISNVVDTQLFDIVERKESPIFRFLHISSLNERKRPQEIIKAVSRLHNEGYNVSLEIGGDGDLTIIDKLLDSLSANEYITTFPTISYSMVANKIQNSDAFILYSTNETQGCVILESYACGKPVISTKVGGAAEFVIEGNSVSVDTYDFEDFYIKLRDVVEGRIAFNTPKVIRNFVVDNFSIPAISQKFSEIYQDTLNK